MTQEEIKLHITNILESELLLNLATSFEDKPSVCVLEFVHDKDFNLYWKSDTESLHSRNILNNPAVAGTITLPLNGKREGVGIQFSGIAEKMAIGKYHELDEQLNRKRDKNISLEIQKKEAGRTWYKLSIKKCYLIHEPLLGYGRLQYLIQ